MVLGLGFRVRTKKDPALKIILHFRSGQTDPGLGHVDKTHNSIDGGSGGFSLGIEMLHFFRNTHDQRAVYSTGIKEALTAGKYPAVIGIVDNYSIFIESVLFEVFDRLPH